MRSSRLAPAVAVVAAFFALSPAGVSARNHPAHPVRNHPGPAGRHRHIGPPVHHTPILRGHCRVTLNVAPTQITVGDSVMAFGQLSCGPGANGAGQSVTLFQHIRGTPGFTSVQSATTEPSGSYEIVLPSVQNSSMFYVRAGNSRSPLRQVSVFALVTLSGPPEGAQLLTGFANRVTFTGTVDPADVGAHVILQRQNALTGNEWRMIDRSSVVGPGGGFTIVHTFRVPGDANLRVLVRSHGRNLASISNVLTYEISQAQNPRLTVNASSDPVPYGQSVTISGVAMGLPSTPVTLLARTVRQHGFAPVAETTTDAGGSYAFPAQAPVNSTLYRVRVRTGSTGGPPRHGVGALPARGTSSAVLYEGVKDVLTAAVSQTTIQAGQMLTFSGSVAPDHTGHIIYLERQNKTNGDFHVVEVSSVGAGSVYSITHRVYDPGTKVFRVRIPGGPENEGAASAPFTIQVTPAPASALTPEGPGNSSMPAEGEQ